MPFIVCTLIVVLLHICDRYDVCKLSCCPCTPLRCNSSNCSCKRLVPRAASHGAVFNQLATRRELSPVSQTKTLFACGEPLIKGLADVLSVEAFVSRCSTTLDYNTFPHRVICYAFVTWICVAFQSSQ